MRSLGILIIAALSPLLANATTFGPETPVVQPAHFSAFGSQFANDVACGDQSCVALWTDSNRLGLFASVIDTNGNVQPGSSNLVSSDGYGASIVWTGDHYLAMWVSYNSSTFVAAPLSRDGRVSGAVQSSSLIQMPESVALAWNGRHVFAVLGTRYGVSGALLDANGSVVRQVALEAKSPLGWAVAASGGTFGVVWNDIVWNDSTQQVGMIRFQRYGDDGTPLDPEPYVLLEASSGDITNAAVAGNATQFEVAYEAYDKSDKDWRLFSLRVDPSSGAMETPSSTPFVHDFSGLYWSGDDFVAYGVDGNSSGPTGAIVTMGLSSGTSHTLNAGVPYMSYPRLAPAATSTFAVWSDPHLGAQTQHVFGAVLDPDATSVVKGDLAISLSTLPQTEPVLAPSGNGALLAWAQQHDNNYADIVVRRLNAAGSPIDAGPVTVATNVPIQSLSAVWLGSAWLVVWTQLDMTVVDSVSGAELRGERISASGELLDPAPLDLGHGSQGVVVSNGSTVILASWSGYGVSFVRLNAKGGPIDSQAITSNSVSGLAAATNGNEFVVAWSELAGKAADGGNIIHLNAVRLTATGQLIEKTPIAIDIHGNYDFDPAIASDGRDFLIAYASGDENGYNLLTKRLLAEGALAGTAAQDEGDVVASRGTWPAIAWDGSEYVIAWDVFDGTLLKMAATTADRSGAVTGIPLVLTSAAYLDPQVRAAVANAQGKVVVAYPRGNAEDGLPQMVTRGVSNGPSRGRGVRH